MYIYGRSGSYINVILRDIHKHNCRAAVRSLISHRHSSSALGEAPLSRGTPRLGHELLTRVSRFGSWLNVVSLIHCMHQFPLCNTHSRASCFFHVLPAEGDRFSASTNAPESALIRYSCYEFNELKFSSELRLIIRSSYSKGWSSK